MSRRVGHQRQEGGRASGHWSEYAPGTGFPYRYRYCRVCKVVWRNSGERPLIHNGRKPKR